MRTQDIAVEPSGSAAVPSPAADRGSAPQGLASRTRVALKGGVALSAHRGLSLAAGLLMIPFAAHTLPVEEFGPWLLLSTIPALLGFLDLGLANGLVTLIATESARGAAGRASIHRYVSSATYMLAALGLMIAVALGLTVSILDLRSAMGASEVVPRDDFALGLLIIVVSVATLIPLSVAQRVGQGLQQMHVVGVTGVAGAVVQLIAACVCAVTGAGFAWFVFTSCVGLLASALLAWVVIFRRIAPDLRPSRRLVNRDAARLVRRRGGAFFVLGVAAAIGFQTDALVISSRLGVEAVPEYAAPYRLFAIAPALITLFALPLWAAHADAFARGEIHWTRRMLRRSTLAAGMLALTVTAALVLVVRPVLSATLGDSDPNPRLALLLAIGATGVVISLSQPLAMLLNAANVLRFQVVIAILMCVSNLALSLILVESIGVAGPPLATAIAQTVCVLVPSLIYIRRMERVT